MLWWNRGVAGDTQAPLIPAEAENYILFLYRNNFLFRKILRLIPGTVMKYEYFDGPSVTVLFRNQMILNLLL